MAVQRLIQLYHYVSGLYVLWEESRIDILSMSQMGISMLAAVILVYIKIFFLHAHHIFFNFSSLETLQTDNVKRRVYR